MMSDVNGITSKVIGAAIEVHRPLGPGLLESAYEACLVYELELLGLSVECQKPLPLVYNKIRLVHGYRLDLLVDQQNEKLCALCISSAKLCVTSVIDLLQNKMFGVKFEGVVYSLP